MPLSLHPAAKVVLGPDGRLSNHRKLVCLIERIERFLEASAVHLQRLRQGLEPIGDLVEPLVTRGARHAGVHVGVVARFISDCRLKIVGHRAYRGARHKVTDLGEEVEMTVRMAGLAHRRLAENVGDVVVALVVRLLCEIEVAHVYLGGSGECLL